MDDEIRISNEAHGAAEEGSAEVPARGAARLRYPCSPGQRRFWVLDRLDPGNPALNIAVRWRLEGRVATADLDRAFAVIAARHQPLRTLIEEVDGEPVQVVEPLAKLRVVRIDLTDLAEADAHDRAAQLALVEARTPFDLATAPLMRVTHLQIREDLAVLLVTAHHLICDGWSVGVLAREMGALIAAGVADGTPDLPALPVSYGEYSQRQAVAATPGCDAFWRERMAQLRRFEIEPDRLRPSVQTANGKIVSLLLEREVTDALAAMSRRLGGTLFMTTLAALYALLQRYSGEDDITVGSQVAGRVEPELEPLIGLFINTLVLRADLGGSPTFSQLLERVRDMVLDAFDHLEMPLDRLIGLLNPERDLSRNALFSVNFIFQKSFIANQEYDSFRLVDMPSCSSGALYDLNFFMVERSDGWRLSLEYNTDLFEDPTAARLVGHLANLMRAVAVDPARPIASLPLLDVAERETLVAWNRTEAAFPESLNVAQLIAAQAQRTPDAVAVSAGGAALSYDQLDSAANRLAGELAQRGVSRGSRVGICVPRSPDLVVALLAVLKAGAAYVPLDPAYPQERLARIVEDAAPALLVTTTALRGRVPSAAVPALLLDAEAKALAQRPDRASEAGATGDDVAYVIYTSGSTGRPKGVQVQHRALTNLLWSMRDQPGLAADDTLVAVTTVCFDIAALELFLPLVVGARLVIAREAEAADGAALLRLLEAERATVMQATPVTWQLLLAAGWRGVPALKMLCGGEALTRPLADQLLPCGALWNLYGPTETTIWSSALRVEPGTGPVPLGPPIANTQFHVLDASGEVVPLGVAGELYIGGTGVALGYLNLPELTAERFVPDPFSNVHGARMYRTGDRVRRRRQDAIEFLGRNDNQVKVRGFRVELGEIEAALVAQPQVHEAAAIAVADASGERIIRAFVAGRAEAPPLGPLLLQALRETLPAYMVPASIGVVDALPRMPNGKLDRAALSTRAPDAGSVPVALPSSPTQRRLLALWSRLLDTHDLPADANFFEVGGHSLLAVRLLARIESEFGRKLSLTAIFQNPTLAAQARLLEQPDERSFDFRQVVRLQPEGTRPPLIAINNTGIYFVLAKHLGRDQPFTSLQLFDPALPRPALPPTLEEIAAGYVRLVRQVQPEGPYALLGWCVAGTLAFEVARQLAAGGSEVSRLILFDTLVPGYLQRLGWLRARLADYSYRWKLIVADWTRVRAGRQNLSAFLSHRTLVKRILRWLGLPATPEPGAVATDGELSPEAYDQWLLQYLQHAAAHYEPSRYRGSVTLFRSSQEPSGRFLHSHMGWDDFVDGGVDVVVVEGDHFNIFQTPRVASMARQIAATG